MMRRLLLGAAAGAAGATALNAVSYVDMAVRGRPASQTPSETVSRLADKSGVAIPGDDDERANRLSALGALSGIAVGAGLGAVYSLLLPASLKRSPQLGTVLLGAGAMLASDLPASKLGVTDPAQWGWADWASDIVPHLAYGKVTALILARANERATPADPRRTR